jgi:response regulator RpfG family c-di-GMP phosphodiesterase
VPLYFRGDDQYKEQEFLLSEFRNTQSQYSRKAKEVEDQQNEYDEVLLRYQSSGDYAVAIAGNLGRTSSATTEHAVLLKEISDLQTGCREIEREISHYQHLANPVEQEHLDKEYAALCLDLQNLCRSIDRADQNRFDHNRLALLAVSSPEFRQAQRSAMEARLAEECAHRLQQDLHDLCNSLSAAPSGLASRRTSVAAAIARSDAALTRLGDDRAEAYLQHTEQRMRRRLAALHRRHALAAALQVVAELNAVMIRLGRDPADIAALRERCEIESPTPRAARPAVLASSARRARPAGSARA